MEENVECCPVEKTLRVIGGKWTILILRDLFSGTKRFGELQRSLQGISPKTLSERLKQLQEQGIIKRTQYPEIPLHVEYALTAKGDSLQAILADMREWGSS